MSNTKRGDVNRLATTEEALRAKITKGSPNFLKINDSSQRYIEVDTGIIRSRRYFLKNEKQVIPEVLSAKNKAENPELHAQRPAPLRKSGRKNKEVAFKSKSVNDWMYYGRQFFTIHQVPELIYTVGKLARSKKFYSYAIVAVIQVDEDVYIRDSITNHSDLSNPLKAESNAEDSIAFYEPVGASASAGQVVGYELMVTPKKEHRDREARASFKKEFETRYTKKRRKA